MTDDDAPLDKSGHHITVGSYIVYGHALGLCAGLRFGKVLEVTEETKKKPNAVTIEFLCDSVPSNLDVSHCRLSAARSGFEASFPVRVITERS